jgi:hypothetical protein
LNQKKKKKKGSFGHSKKWTQKSLIPFISIEDKATVVLEEVKEIKLTKKKKKPYHEST